MSVPSQPMDFTHLSIPERIIVVEQIWDSIAEEGESIQVTPAQAAELDRRLESFHDSPDEGSSFDEVKSRIQAETK